MMLFLMIMTLFLLLLDYITCFIKCPGESESSVNTLYSSHGSSERLVEQPTYPL